MTTYEEEPVAEEPDPAAEAADAADDVEEVQETVDAIEDDGFIGTKVDPIPNEEYALTTGPDSPSSNPPDPSNEAVAADEEG